MLKHNPKTCVRYNSIKIAQKKQFYDILPGGENNFMLEPLRYIPIENDTNRRNLHD